jgi:hypothetical protein
MTTSPSAPAPPEPPVTSAPAPPPPPPPAVRAFPPSTRAPALAAAPFPPLVIPAALPPGPAPESKVPAPAPAPPPPPTTRARDESSKERPAPARSSIETAGPPVWNRRKAELGATDPSRAPPPPEPRLRPRDPDPPCRGPACGASSPSSRRAGGLASPAHTSLSARATSGLDRQRPVGHERDGPGQPCGCAGEVWVVRGAREQVELLLPGPCGDRVRLGRPGSARASRTDDDGQRCCRHGDLLGEDHLSCAASAAAPAGWPLPNRRRTVVHRRYPRPHHLQRRRPAGRSSRHPLVRSRSRIRAGRRRARSSQWHRPRGRSRLRLGSARQGHQPDRPGPWRSGRAARRGRPAR